MEANSNAEITQKPVNEIINPNEQALKFIDEEFSKRNINYFVIGSTARRAYLKENPNVVSDIDLLTPDPSQKELVSEALKAVDERSNQNGLKADIDNSLSGLLVFENGEYHLRYGKSDYLIDGKLMAKRRVKLGNSEFTTFAPQTLLHTYFAGGPWREKDWRNALNFARF